ncbi:MAG TPA: hypothetical protein EYP30_04275 [Archaeoglobaceae archaeon]|nr:hypothetical protein [Archaeoglobaceae archaeon]
MRVYLMLILLGISLFLAGCEEVIEPEEQTEQLYGIDYSVILVDNFIPAIDVRISGEPRDLKIQLISPDENTTIQRVFTENFTEDSVKLTFRISEPGELPLIGKYRIRVLEDDTAVASKSFRLNGPNLVIKDVKFNTSPTTIWEVSLRIENEGDTPGFVQHANIRVAEPEQVAGWLFYEGIEPQKSVNIIIPRHFEIKEEGSHVNIWLYYKGKLVSSYETDVRHQ